MGLQLTLMFLVAERAGDLVDAGGEGLDLLHVVHVHQLPPAVVERNRHLPTARPVPCHPPRGATPGDFVLAGPRHRSLSAQIELHQHPPRRAETHMRQQEGRGPSRVGQTQTRGRMSAACGAARRVVRLRRGTTCGQAALCRHRRAGTANAPCCRGSMRRAAACGTAPATNRPAHRSAGGGRAGPATARTQRPTYATRQHSAGSRHTPSPRARHLCGG